MRIVGWAYTLVVIAGTVWMVRPAAGTRAGHLAGHPRARNDAEPVHGDLRRIPIPVAGDARSCRSPAVRRRSLPFVFCWCALALGFGPASISPQWNAAWTTVQTVLTFVLRASVLRQLRTPEPEDAAVVRGATAASVA